jgi:predicted acyl esterase
LFDAFWQSKAADLARITVPAYVVASWSDQGLHTRGTLEGFLPHETYPSFRLA